MRVCVSSRRGKFFYLKFIDLSSCRRHSPAIFTCASSSHSQGGRSMSTTSLLAMARQHFAVGTSLFALLANMGAPVPAAAQQPPTAVTPIQHVIVIIGENRSFDHVYATYQPANGQTVSNLLSKGIINAKGGPGAN